VSTGSLGIGPSLQVQYIPQLTHTIDSIRSGPFGSPSKGRGSPGLFPGLCWFLSRDSGPAWKRLHEPTQMQLVDRKHVDGVHGTSDDNSMNGARSRPEPPMADAAPSRPNPRPWNSAGSITKASFNCLNAKSAIKMRPFQGDPSPPVLVLD
jgi:hypothetical protein